MLAAIVLIAFSARAVVIHEQRLALLAMIDTDIAGLADGMAAGGAPEVARRIADRSALLGPTSGSYRLSDPRGVVIVGDLPATALDAGRSASGDIATAHGAAIARATMLRGGYTLVVARALAPTERLTDRLMRVFWWAAVPAALGSLAVGALVALRVGARVGRLNTTFTQFARGDYKARSGAPAGRDELALLASHVDRHLGHAELMIEAQRQISENIAHELRTPLFHLDTRLLSALDVARESVLVTSLHAARDDIRSIVSLLNVLLDLALADAPGQHDGDLFDLSAHITGLAEMYEDVGEEAGVTFTRRIEPRVTMPGEPMAMTRVVANLLDNAFKFTAAGGHVRLSVEPGPRIVVEDNGPGVAKDDRARIFERFQSADHAGRGHGLGLALVRVIASRHGLEVRVEDAAPGARFVITAEQLA